MQAQLNYNCEEHGVKCPDVIIKRNRTYDYFLIASNATYSCYYCPWCGQDLDEFHGLKHSRVQIKSNICESSSKI